MDFEEWYLENSADAAMDVLKDAFEAGQQSKQAEIDALKEKLKKLQAVYDDCTEYTAISELLDSIKELLK